MDKKISDEDFIERYMYINRSSKNVWVNALMYGILGGLAIGCGIYMYNSLSELEQVGGSIKVNRLVRFFYSIGGVNGVLIAFLGIGISSLYKGYKSYQNKNI